jgi:hypothetical protein
MCKVPTIHRIGRFKPRQSSAIEGLLIRVERGYKPEYGVNKVGEASPPTWASFEIGGRFFPPLDFGLEMIHTDGLS